MAYSREEKTGILVLKDNKKERFTTIIGNKGAIFYMPPELLEPWFESGDRFAKIGCYYVPDEKVSNFCGYLYSLRSDKIKILNTIPALRMGLKALEAGLNNS